MPKKSWILNTLPLQGVTNERALPQGVASLALGYVLLPFQGVHSWMQNHAEYTLDFASYLTG